jgi:hypothetical protein
MKPDYIKIAAITFVVLFTSFVGYGSYQVFHSLSERSDSKTKLQNKKFPLSTIRTLDGQAIDINAYNDQTKMVIFLSVRCPHCLHLLKAFKENTTFPKDNIFPIFKVEPSAIDSFSKVNDLTGLTLYHVKESRINQIVKSAPTFLIIDSTNKIKKVYHGIPRLENNDSLVAFVHSLFTKEVAIKNNTPTESCH